MVGLPHIKFCIHIFERGPLQTLFQATSFIIFIKESFQLRQYRSSFDVFTQSYNSYRPHQALQRLTPLKTCSRMSPIGIEPAQFFDKKQILLENKKYKF